MICNVVLVSGAQQSDSVIYIFYFHGNIYFYLMYFSVDSLFYFYIFILKKAVCYYLKQKKDYSSCMLVTFL